MRGRKPKPTFLKLVSGNPGHRPLNLDEPEPSVAISSTRRRGSVHGSGFCGTKRFELRHRACCACSTRRCSKFSSLRKAFTEHAAQKVEQLGGVVAAPVTKQPMKNPYLSILNQQAAIMTKCISEMGFSPSSRSRVKVVGKRKQTYFGKLKMFKPD